MSYYIRLDDACEKRDICRWNRIEKILDKYDIIPLVGIIPCCEDPMMEGYKVDDNFWNRVNKWHAKGWVIAMHGHKHVFVTEDGGINPVNKKSEFAGVSLDVQKLKIRDGVEIFRLHGLEPKVFFAPAHTFDRNTLVALKKESNIRVISDTIASKPYFRWGFTFIPQQSGHVRKLPFNTVTFCYHPNNMNNTDFEALERFIVHNRKRFGNFEIVQTKRKYSLLDSFLNKIYFFRRR